MYKKSNSIKSSNQDFSNYIEGYDVYNARILDLLKNYEDDKEDFIITTKDYRPDLIAEKLYGSTNYTAFLMITCSLNLSDYKKGTVLRVLPKKILEKIILQLS
jgi:hypothetical protein